MRTDVSDSELIGGSPAVHARVAGVVGAVVLGSGSFAGFVSSNLIVGGDPAATSIYMLNEVNLFASLSLASQNLFDQVALFLGVYRFGNTIAAIFFGLWLLPLGLLVFRSGFLPGFLGLLLMLGTLGYLVLFVQAFFFGGAERTLWSNPLLVITHVSELALLLWLLIKGVDVEKWDQTIGRVVGAR